jgi:hypothetical protein
MGRDKMFAIFFLVILAAVAQGCTVKAVGDPNRPITINAHITLDIKGLEKTASSIEDYVSGAPAQGTVKTQGGK